MSKIEKTLFYLFVFSLPFQTRWIIYQWSVGGSGFNEWTSAYLYLTDILLIMVFLFWFWRQKSQRYFKNGFEFSRRLKTAGFWLIVFLAIAFISLVKVRNIGLGFYGWFKLLEMAVLFFYLMCHSEVAVSDRRISSDNNNGCFLRDSSPPARHASQGEAGGAAQNDRINFRNLARVFVLSGFSQSIIAWFQFVKQESLDLKWLAESPLSLNKVGVAKIAANGVKMLRAYAGLPHPNLLAAFLFTSIFFLYFLWLSREHLLIGHLSFLAVFYCLFFALFLTFSRTAILAFISASFLYFIICLWQVVQTADIGLFKRLVLVFLVFIFLSLFFFFAFRPEISSRFNISLKEEAVSLRIFYNETALATISRQPGLGLGINNFVWEIRDELYLLAPWMHQPVHNIYLLIAAETGLIGLVAFLMFIFLSIMSLRATRRPLTGGAGNVAISFIPRNLFILLFLSFLFIGLFDHFFLTLQQGQLLFWLVLGLIAAFAVAPCQKEQG